MVSAPHDNIPQQSHYPLIFFLYVPTKFAIDFLFLMRTYGLLRVIIRHIDRACFPKLPPAQGCNEVRTSPGAL